MKFSHPIRIVSIVAILMACTAVSRGQAAPAASAAADEPVTLSAFTVSDTKDVGYTAVLDAWIPA